MLCERRGFQQRRGVNIEAGFDAPPHRTRAVFRALARRQLREGTPRADAGERAASLAQDLAVERVRDVHAVACVIGHDQRVPFERCDVVEEFAGAVGQAVCVTQRGQRPGSAIAISSRASRS